MNRTLPAPVERAEGNHLHDPSAGIREGCAGVVGPGRRHDTIFRNVAVWAGEQLLREPAAVDVHTLLAPTKRSLAFVVANPTKIARLIARKLRQDFKNAFRRGPPVKHLSTTPILGNQLK